MYKLTHSLAHFQAKYFHFVATAFPIGGQGKKFGSSGFRVPGCSFRFRRVETSFPRGAFFAREEVRNPRVSRIVPKQPMSNLRGFLDFFAGSTFGGLVFAGKTGFFEGSFCRWGIGGW